jgi:hypothetical protein
MMKPATVRRTFEFHAVVEEHHTLDGDVYYVPSVEWNPHPGDANPAMRVTYYPPSFASEVDAVEWLHGTVREETKKLTAWADR